MGNMTKMMTQQQINVKVNGKHITVSSLECSLIVCNVFQIVNII